MAYKYGAWSPADVPYTDLLNTRFPWAFVLFGGFLPAVSEEFLFRMFAIPFLRKITRSVAVAVVLAGFIWGFGHAGYPQQPFYIRGVEVGIGGVALGIIMLRFGILPTLVWHYSVDAMYSAMLLVRSESLYFKLSGMGAAGIMVLPVLIALVAYWRYGGFEPETGLLNRDDAGEPGVQEAALPEAETDATAAACGAAGFPALPSDGRPPAVGLCRGAGRWESPRWPSLSSHFGESPNYQLSRDRARAAADAFVKSLGLDPAAFQRVTLPRGALGGAGCARRQVLSGAPPSRRRVGAVRTESSDAGLDHALFQIARPGRDHGQRASGNRQGHGIQPHDPGDRSRERTSTWNTRDEIAAQFAKSLGWDTSAMDLKESSTEQKKARRDYSLEWEARPGDPRNVGETRWRVEVNVAGDRVVSARGFWKLPEAWQRGREQQNALAIAIAVLKIGTLAALIVYGLWLLLQGTRQGMVRWHAALRLALPATLLFPVAPLLSIGLMLKNYRTDVPLETFQAMNYVIVGMGFIFGFLLMGAAAALIVTFYPDAVAALRRTNRAVMAVDAIAALLAATGLGARAASIPGHSAGPLPRPGGAVDRQPGHHRQRRPGPCRGRIGGARRC